MTAQIGDELILDGVRHTMQCAPDMPEGHAFIRKSPPGHEYIQCSALWRGYVATWEIARGKLYLNAIEGRYDDVGAYRMTTKKPIPATWVTDTLRIPHGRILRRVHQGFSTFYEEEELIKVSGGLVTERTRIDFRDIDFAKLEAAAAKWLSDQ